MVNIFHHYTQKNNPHKIYLTDSRFTQAYVLLQTPLYKKTACYRKACNTCVLKACANQTHKNTSQWENRGGKPQRQEETARKNKCEYTRENHWFTQIKQYLGQVCTHNNGQADPTSLWGRPTYAPCYSTVTRSVQCVS